MRQLSASSVHAAFRCGYAFRPDVWTAPDVSGEAAEFGTRVHELVEDVLRSVGPFEKFAYEPGDSDSDEARHATQAVCWVRDHSPGMPSYLEKGVIYDCANDTATWGPRRGEPGYGGPSTYRISGTIDMAWVFGGMLWVVDLKTGKKENAHPEQLYFQALALSRILGIETVHVGFLFSRKTKVIPPQWETLTDFRLDCIAADLRDLMRSLPTAEPQRHGECHYCPAVTRCPAFAIEAPEARFDDEFADTQGDY